VVCDRRRRNRYDFDPGADEPLFLTVLKSPIGDLLCRARRNASPSAAIIDSQTVKTAEAGGPCGYDAGKKINGRKRHALVDTDGRGLVLEPHPASIQDRDGGGPLLRASRQSFPFIERVFADSGYAGERVTTATLIAVEGSYLDGLHYDV
jgi:hypothetical protein